jgi:phenylacetate-CoA ligase
VETAPWADFIRRWHEGAVPAEELHAWQLAALRTVLAHVRDRSPFYGRRLADVDLDLRDLAELSRIPFTTKDDLRTAMHDMLTGPVSQAQFYFETTGTTGRPTPCPRAAIDFDLNVLPLTQALDGVVRKHFADAGERPVLAVVAPNDVHAACLSLSFAAKQLGIAKLDLFPISPTLGFARFFEVLVELKVNMLLCSPGLLMSLAEMSSTYGVEVPEDLHLKVLLTTGEMCSDGMRDLLAQTWDSAVYNFMYGSQEAGCPAVTRPDGSMVAVDPTYLLEVLDPLTEESVGFEGYGELCLTTLVPGLKPLIRYRTGDLVRIVPDGTGRRTVEVLGRVKDMTRIGDGLRSAAEVDDAVLADPRLVYGYEIDVCADAGEDRLVVRLKAKEGVDHAQLKLMVRGRLAEAFGVRSEIEIHPLLDLKSATGGWVSWKTARITDLRSHPEEDDIEVRSAADLARAVERAI